MYVSEPTAEGYRDTDENPQMFRAQFPGMQSTLVQLEVRALFTVQR